MNANYSTILEDNRQKISRTLEIPAEEVQIIPVSSAAKLRYLSSGSASMLQNSNYAALEDAIWTSIARRKGEVLILPFLAAAKNELLKQMDSVAAQYQVLGSNQNVAQELIDELNRKTAALEELQEKGADWRNHLALFFSTLQNDISKTQQQLGTDARAMVQTRYRELESRICSEKNYTALLGDINELIGQGVLNIREDIAQKVEEQSAELQKQLQFGISVHEDILGGLGFEPEDMSITFPRKKAMDTAIRVGRTIGINSMGTRTVGSILGGFIGLCFGGPIGMLLGANIGAEVGSLAGGAKGCLDTLTQHDQTDVNIVLQAMNQHIATSMSGINATTNNTIAALRSALNSSFEHQLKQQAKSLKDNASQLKRNINISVNEVPQKRAALKEQNAQLLKQLKQYEALERAADGLNRTADRKAPDSRPAGAEEISYGFL